MKPRQFLSNDATVNEVKRSRFRADFTHNPVAGQSRASEQIRFKEYCLRFFMPEKQTCDKRHHTGKSIKIENLNYSYVY